MTTKASGTNRRFEHSESTTAARAEVWRLWTDVSSWRQWDQGLNDATLDGEFVEGATGTIVPHSGPTTSFTITSLDPGNAYTFVTKLPGARLHVHREFIDGPTTTFRHTVWFTGPFAWLWGRLAGRSFRRQLPPTMRIIAQRATQLQHDDTRPHANG